MEIHKAHMAKQTQTNTPEIGPHWETSWGEAPHWASSLAKRPSTHPTPLPCRLQNRSLAPVHEIWNKDELYTTPVHLTCQIYTPYAAAQELRRWCTCSPVWQGSDASFRCPHWIILPECIIDTFNLSCRSVFDLSLQASQAGCIIECRLWFVSV